jgi:hypothetical protein
MARVINKMNRVHHVAATRAHAENSVYTPRLEGASMPKYVIERNFVGAGQLSPAELAALSDRSCSALRSFGSRVQWVESYVTRDKIYCIYVAPNENLIREHTRLTGFPVNHVAEVKHVIDPTTSEAAVYPLDHELRHDLAKEAGVY